MEEKYNAWAGRHSQLWTSPKRNPTDHTDGPLKANDSGATEGEHTVSPSRRGIVSPTPYSSRAREIERSTSVVRKILIRLCGSEATKKNERETQSLEEDLYRVLFEVEKCDEVAHGILERDGQTVQNVPLKEMLVEMSKAVRRPKEHADMLNNTSNTQSASVLAQVMDILESYGSVENERDAPTVLLRVVSELERMKRDATLNALILSHYESAIKDAMGHYGELSPPLIKTTENMLSNQKQPPSVITTPWIEEPFRKLSHTVDSISALHDDVMLGPTVAPPFCVSDAESTQKNVLVLLESANQCVKSLSEKCIHKKEGFHEHTTVLQDEQQFTKFDGHGSASATLPLTGAVLSTGLSSSAEDTTATGPAQAWTGAERVLVDLVRCLPPSTRKQFSLDGAAWPRLDEQFGTRLVQAFETAARSSTGDEDAKDTGNSIFTINSMNRALQRTFLGNEAVCEDDSAVGQTVPQAVALLERTVSIISTFPDDARRREGALQAEARDVIEELAQLLPVDASLAFEKNIRVEPPTNDLLEMTHILRSRYSEWIQQRQKQFLSGAQGRLGRARMEDAVRTYGTQMLQLMREMIMMSDGDVDENSDGAAAATLLEESATTADGREGGITSSPLQVDLFLNDLVERLKFLKAKYSRSTHSLATNNSRLESASQKNAAYGKKLKRVCTVVERICTSLGVHPRDADRSTHANSSSLDKDTTAASVGGEVSEINVVDVLKHIETRVGSDDAVKQRAASVEEAERLRAGEQRWKSDSAAFREAMVMIVSRLAEAGRLTKQALFMIGTDESAKDEVIEEVLNGGDGNRANSLESIEEQLAVLLQKYSRWSKRLQEATEDHLHTQRKIIKYFAAVRRFFYSREEKLPNEDILDDNLIDIDTCLMRFADTILPALDRAIRAAELPSSSTYVGESDNASGDTGSATPKDSVTKNDVLSQLARRSVGKQLLPYDHRLGQLYEMVGKLHTMVSSLLRVRYLSIPQSVRQRSSGDTELIFEDTNRDDGFVDMDLEKLFISTKNNRKDRPEEGAQSTKFSRDAGSTPPPQSPSEDAHPPRRTASENDDLLFRVTARNLESLHESLRKFSSNHKMAAILIQKDTDTLQKLLAGMLEKYSELDIERAFGQDREVLHDLYTTLLERGTRQKGCYFFSRPGGEGPCAWLVALEQVSLGFGQIVDKLVQRTASVAEYRELVDAAVDLCALYVNWAEMTDGLPADHALSADILDCCVRDNNGDSPTISSDKVENKLSVDGNALALPPKPMPSSASLPGDIKRPGSVPPTGTMAAQGAVNMRDDSTAYGITERSKVSCFTKDDIILKVMQHMFQLAQEAVEAQSRAAEKMKAREGPSPQQLREEMNALRSAVEAAESDVAAAMEARNLLVQERDLAQSEAAVARAELRRWQRASGPANTTPAAALQIGVPLALPQPVVDPGASTTIAVARNPNSVDENQIDRDCVHELLHYMKALSEELNYAQHVARGHNDGRSTDTNSSSDVEHEAVPPQDQPSSAARRTSVTKRLHHHPELVSSPRRTERNQKGEAQRYLREQYDSPVVVIDPAAFASRYSGGAGRSARGKESVAVEERYSPDKYQGLPFEACEACTRHHGDDMPVGLVEAELSIEATTRDRAAASSPQQRRPTSAVRRYKPDGYRSNAPADTTLRHNRGVAGKISDRHARAHQSHHWDNRHVGQAASANHKENADRNAAATAEASLRHRLHRLQDSDDDRFFDEDRYMPRLSPRDFLPSRRMRSSSMRKPSTTSPSAVLRSRRVSSGVTSLSARGGTAIAMGGRARSPDGFNDALKRITDDEESLGQVEGRVNERRRSLSTRRAGGTTSQNAATESANLRNAALRRLAEVVSATKVRR